MILQTMRPFITISNPCLIMLFPFKPHLIVSDITINSFQMNFISMPVTNSYTVLKISQVILTS